MSQVADTWRCLLRQSGLGSVFDSARKTDGTIAMAPCRSAASFVGTRRKIYNYFRRGGVRDCPVSCSGCRSSVARWTLRHPL